MSYVCTRDRGDSRRKKISFAGRVCRIPGKRFIPLVLQVVLRNTGSGVCSKQIR